MERAAERCPPAAAFILNQQELMELWRSASLLANPSIAVKYGIRRKRPVLRYRIRQSEFLGAYDGTRPLPVVLLRRCTVMDEFHAGTGSAVWILLGVHTQMGNSTGSSEALQTIMGAAN